MKYRSARSSPPSYALILAVGFAGLTGGCGLAERAEALYLRQQGVQGALASTLSEVEMAHPALAEQLYGLEDDLHMACEPLRVAGQRRIKGQELGSNLEWAVVTTLQACETKTDSIERLVQQADSGETNLDMAQDASPSEIGR